MRIVIFGPTFPLKGGIALHTTDLAHRLAAAGHEVQVESWKAPYPKRLYPGQLELDRAEMPRFSPVERRLVWFGPWSWLASGRRRRNVDVAVFVATTPPQLVAYHVVVTAMGRRRRKVAVAHNVVPHEARPGDRWLLRSFLRRMNGVLVHSESELRSADSLGIATARQVQLPPTLGPRSSLPVERPPTGRLLFFGFIRPYKGLDVLLDALVGLPNDVSLIIAGEDWGLGDELQMQIRDAGLEGRVELRTGYVSTEDVRTLFAQADALVLPYRSGTGSQVPRIAHHHGVPVVATRVGDLADQVRDGVDGLLCEPADVEDLRKALAHLYEPGHLVRLRRGIRPPDVEGPWQDYLAAILAT